MRKKSQREARVRYETESFYVRMFHRETAPLVNFATVGEEGGPHQRCLHGFHAAEDRNYLNGTVIRTPMVFSVRFTPGERTLIEQYASRHGTTISEVIRRATLEMIEDETDAELAVKAWEEFQKDPVTYTQEEIEKMLGLR